jgi:DNA topoisomerase I
MPAAALASESKELRLDPVEAARKAGLRYVSDRKPGISRHKRGKGFVYRSPDGALLRDTALLLRIRRLAVPPAWSEVWICSFEGGHIQATGRDARGRKQYRYHARFRAVRDETKYERLFDFVAALPKIRAQCERDLSLPGLPRAKVLAAVVRLLEQTLIRVGNEEYSRANQSFGLTTLRDRHARIQGSELSFRFRGKSGKEHKVSLNDRRLAKIVKRCRDLPGDELFQYLDEQGEQHTVDSADVNEYLRAVTGDEFSAKDFRTWAGTLYTALSLHELGGEHSERARKRRIKQAIVRTAERLGNTAAVCRKCYVHPGILDAYLAGRVVPRVAGAGTRASTRLSADERAVLLFLRQQLTLTKRSERRAPLGDLLKKSVRQAKGSLRRA